MPTPTIELNENHNFGQWRETINDIIDGLSANDDNTKYLQDMINAAVSTGQMGDAVSSTNCDLCVHSGLYHINSINNKPAMNLYVASNGDCVTQIAVTEEKTPKISIRNRSSSQSNFSNWMLAAC